MFRSILVPLDGSAFAEAALPHALSLAERSGGELILAHVSPAPTAAWLDRVAARARKTAPDIELRTVTLAGEPVASLHRFVVEEGVDQVVMTTHGAGGLARAWLGSVADGLVRRTPAPILLIRSHDDQPKADLSERPVFERILVPLDGSEPSEAIIPWAEALARLHQASLILASVVPSEGGFTGYLPSTGGLDAELEAAAAELEGYLGVLAERLRARDTRVSVRVVTGPPPAEAILALREESGSELMAFATSGRGGVARLLLGSVADQLIRATDSPVLVFRARAEG